MKRETIAILCVLFLLMTGWWFSVNLKANSNVLLQCKRKYKVTWRRAIDVTLKRDVWLTIPKFIKIKHFRFLQVSEKIYKVEVETHAPIPIKTKDNILFILFFRDRYPLSTIGITCGIGPSPYHSPAPSHFGHLEGGVYSAHLGQSRWIAPLKSAIISGSKVTFEFASKFIQHPGKFYQLAFVILYSPHGFEFMITRVDKAKFVLADGVDFEFPHEGEIIYMTCSGFPPPP